MKKFRAIFLKWHLYISLFFIPMAIFYKITGIAGIFDYFGAQDSKIIDLNQSDQAIFKNIGDPSRQSSKEELQRARNLLLEFLAKRALDIPYTTNITDSWDNKRYVLGGAAKYIEIDKENPKNMILYTRDLMSNLITLHFARGGLVFNILAFCFVIFMFITYVTGILISPFAKNKYKYSAIIALGFLVTIICAFISLL